MTLLERISQLNAGLFCVKCHRSGCSVNPCPDRRSATLRGVAIGFKTYSELTHDRRAEWDARDDRSDLQPHTRTTAFK